MKAVKELREMKVDALTAKLAELNKEMFRLNGLRASGAVAENPSRMRQVRRTIARVHTLLREKAGEQ